MGETQYLLNSLESFVAKTELEKLITWQLYNLVKSLSNYNKTTSSILPLMKTQSSVLNLLAVESKNQNLEWMVYEFDKILGGLKWE